MVKNFAPGQPGRRRLRLPGHLHGHLDRHRARVGEEDVGEPDQLDEPAAELDRGTVGEPAEHDVRHPGELVGGGRVELGYGVPVDRAPPRRHRVDDLDRLAIPAQPQAYAARGLDLVDGGGRVLDEYGCQRCARSQSRRSWFRDARRARSSTTEDGPVLDAGGRPGPRGHLHHHPATAVSAVAGRLHGQLALAHLVTAVGEGATAVSAVRPPRLSRPQICSLSALIGIFRSSSSARSSSGSRPRVVR